MERAFPFEACKKYFKSLHNFSGSKSVVPVSTIATRTTTLCPQKHHAETPISSKTPVKTPNHHAKYFGENYARRFFKMSRAIASRTPFRKWIDSGAAYKRPISRLSLMMIGAGVAG
jgi:hypothetical protein